MVIPATRDGKACAWPFFCLPGAGALYQTVQVLRGGCLDPSLGSYAAIIDISLFSSPAAHCALVFGLNIL
jgi:hypothetical protein